MTSLKCWNPREKRLLKRPATFASPDRIAERVVLPDPGAAAGGLQRAVVAQAVVDHQVVPDAGVLCPAMIVAVAPQVVAGHQHVRAGADQDGVEAGPRDAEAADPDAGRAASEQAERLGDDYLLVVGAGAAPADSPSASGLAAAPSAIGTLRMY